MIVAVTLVQHVIYIISTNTCQRPSRRKLTVLEFLPKTPYSLSILWLFRATLLRGNCLAKLGSENSSDSKSLKKDKVILMIKNKRFTPIPPPFSMTSCVRYCISICHTMKDRQFLVSFYSKFQFSQLCLKTTCHLRLN